MFLRMRTILLAIGLICISSIVGLAERQPAVNLLPEETLAFARILDTSEVAEKFKNSSFGRMVDDPQMKPFLTGLWESLNEAAAQIEEEVGLTLEELISIPDGEIAFGIVPQESGSLAFVLFIDLGEKPATAEKAMEALRELAVRDGAAIESNVFKETKITSIDGRGGILSHFIKDNSLVLSNQTSQLEDILTHWNTPRERSLKDNAKYTTIISSSRGTQDEPAQIAWFADPINLTKEAVKNAPGSSYFIAFLPVLGLDGIEAVGGSQIMGAEDFETISHLHVMLERPRSGILEMVAPKNTDPKPADWVPADVTNYMTVDWDIEKTFNALEKLYDSVSGEGALASNLESRLNEPLGIHFKQEVIDNLEGRISLVQWYEPPARFNSQATMIGLRLKDPAAMQRTIETILNTFPGANDRLEKKTFATFSYYQTVLNNQPLDDDIPEDRRRRIERFRRMRPQPCFAIIGDYLLAADRPGLLEHAMKAKRDVAERLADDLSFKLIVSKVQKQVGERNLGMLTFSKPEQGLRLWYEMAQDEQTREFMAQRSEDNPVFKALSTNLDKHPLPPFTTLSKYFMPAGSIMINDETGIHFMAFELKKMEEGE